MSVTLTIPARAKINLALHVTGRRTDGYHLLDSLVMFADVGDKLVLSPAKQTTLEITGPFADTLRQGGGENLIVSAHKAMLAAFPDKVWPTRFRLTKNLPVASGIGGGSANAAAALAGIVGLYDLGIVDLEAIALNLGADVPVCLEGHAARMRGIGEDIENLPDAPQLEAVLVNPGVAVSTATVFKALGLSPGDVAHGELASLPVPAQPSEVWIDWLSKMRNDLQAPAIHAASPVAKTLDVLANTQGCLLSRMSGSGATCFGLYDTAHSARSAAAVIAAQHPDWWVKPTRFNG